MFPITLAEWRLLGSGTEPRVWGVDHTIVPEEERGLKIRSFKYSKQFLLAAFKTCQHVNKPNTVLHLSQHESLCILLVFPPLQSVRKRLFYRGQAATGRSTGILASLRRCKVWWSYGHCKPLSCETPALKDLHLLFLGCSSLLPQTTTAAPAHTGHSCTWEGEKKNNPLLSNCTISMLVTWIFAPTDALLNRHRSHI